MTKSLLSFLGDDSTKEVNPQSVQSLIDQFKQYSELKKIAKEVVAMEKPSEQIEEVAKTIDAAKNLQAKLIPEPTSIASNIKEVRELIGEVQKFMVPTERKGLNLGDRIDEALMSGFLKRLTKMREGGEESSIEHTIKQIELGDKLRERFTPKVDISEKVSQSSVRTELTKLLLEDERERMRIEKGHVEAIEKIRQEAASSSESSKIARTFFEEIMGAMRERKIETKNPEPTPPPQPQGDFCPGCGQEVIIHEKPSHGIIHCPACRQTIRV